MTIEVKVGKITIGGNNPIVIQTMTDTPTSNIEATVIQTIKLINAGAEIVRLTVDTLDSARAIPYIKEYLVKQGYGDIPLVGCFHYNGHTLLEKVPACAEILDKYRINPGNIGSTNTRDKNFETIINSALKYNKSIRIGVNWGSLDKKLLQDKMDYYTGMDDTFIIRQAMIESALISAQVAEKIGLNQIILSAKVSDPNELIHIYTELSKKSHYPLHLGLTEAGPGMNSIVATTYALSYLLKQGIGNTIRASLTSQERTDEVKLCQLILQNLNMRSFIPTITSCPACGRTNSDEFKRLAIKIENFITEIKNNYKGIEKLKIAVMGCIVNGPGESQYADIGISLPGNNEHPSAVVYIKGRKAHTLRDNIEENFKKIILDYLNTN